MRYSSGSEASHIAFLGPAGTYSDQAALLFAERMGIEDVVLLPCASFTRVFDAVDQGHAEYGVVAIENSIEGPVTATLDSFATRETATILGEQVVDIHHCLLLNRSASPADIAAIASHPQALAQCRCYVEEHFPNATTIPVGSTAESAVLAAHDPTVAAIANQRAASISNLAIYATSIEDHPGDQTSFALIARHGHAPVFEKGAAMKTSLALYLHADKPGALQMILSEFAYGGINLTKIQSRPTKRKLGEYMFFIDLDGSVDDDAVRIALECLRLKLRAVKVLGCYPRC